MGQSQGTTRRYLYKDHSGAGIFQRCSPIHAQVPSGAIRHPQTRKKERKPMPTGRTNRNRGFGFEREIVNDAKRRGLDAERAFGSNGRALAEAESVDVKVQGCRVQAKRRKTLPAYLQIPDGCDVVMFRQDRGKTLVLMDYEDFMEQLQDHGW